MKILATDRHGKLHTLVAEQGSVMEALRDGGLEVEAVCGGCCSCATCHIHVHADWQERVGERGAVEAQLLSLSESFDAASSRLSCQIDCSDALDGLCLTVAPED